MVAGEAGADYVLFGEPDSEGDRPATEAILERVAWWAELFEPPCVAYAATLEEVAHLRAPPAPTSSWSAIHLERSPWIARRPDGRRRRDRAHLSHGCLRIRDDHAADDFQGAFFC